jgi:hypothetical protein
LVFFEYPPSASSIVDGTLRNELTIAGPDECGLTPEKQENEQRQQSYVREQIVDAHIEQADKDHCDHYQHNFE